ncbi:MAG: hypothetical protein KDA61_11990, partial [Planctomycetales bacterium]|nr:hypothetical protein [Planctomycetales bacterium]
FDAPRSPTPPSPPFPGATQRTVHYKPFCLLSSIVVGLAGAYVDAHLGARRGVACAAEALEEGRVMAPPGTSEIEPGVGGAWFVDSQLVARLRELKSSTRQVQNQIRDGALGSAEATERLQQLQADAAALKQAIDEEKIYVAAMEAFEDIDEQTFAMGDGELLLITSDDVRVRGWEGPGLKCVLKRSILAATSPAAEEFAAIQLKHNYGPAPEAVGHTQAERDEMETKFLASEPGRILNEEQLTSRRQFLAEIHRSYDAYGQFQGKPVHQVELTGLGYQQGNRQASLRIDSPDGSATVSSVWKRRAELTVYVPPCQAVAVRGCGVGLDIKGVQGDLVLTTHESRDRNFNGAFEVRQIDGNVTIEQAPVQVLSEISGDVVFTATDEFVNQGTTRSAGSRTMYVDASYATRIDNVVGRISGTFLRTDLTLRACGGPIDVENAYGDTRCDATGLLATGLHRITSHSGSIRVTGERSALTAIPIYAFTQCGRLETNLEEDALESRMFSTGQPRRGWTALTPPPPERQLILVDMNRPAAILANQERTPGLDLLSHAGHIDIEAE